MRKNAFTMIELVFVIVVLGILASVAIPKLAATRTDAKISAAKATVAALRSGIVSWRQQRMLQGVTDCSALSDLSTVLQYTPDIGTVSGTGYSVTIDGQTCSFSLDQATCKLSTTSTGTYCQKID